MPESQNVGKIIAQNPFIQPKRPVFYILLGFRDGGRGYLRRTWSRACGKTPMAPLLDSPADSWSSTLPRGLGLRVSGLGFRVILGLDGENGKSNGNYYNKLGFYGGYMGVIFLDPSM